MLGGRVLRGSLNVVLAVFMISKVDCWRALLGDSRKVLLSMTAKYSVSFSATGNVSR